MSALLAFCWYEPVYVRDPLKQTYPSSTSERSGRIVGIAEHQGDALTFLVLDDIPVTLLRVLNSAPRLVALLPISALLLAQMVGRSHPMMVSRFNHQLMLQEPLLIHLI